MNWIKSSYSAESANCVEVALDPAVHTGPEVVVRNSKQLNGPRVRFTLAEWDAFQAGAANGEFTPERLTPH